MAADLWAPVDTNHPVIATGYHRLRLSLAAALGRGEALAGWKVGWNDRTVREQLAIPTGVVGYLLGRTTRTAPSWSLRGMQHPAAEVEVAAVLRDEVRPGDDDAPVLAAVAALAPAIEVLDLVEVDSAEAIARNIWHAGAVLGAPVAFDPARPPELAGTSWKNGRPPRPLPRAPDLVADLPAILRFVAGGASALGASLAPGHVVICGNLAEAAIPVRAGEALTADLGRLGRLSVTFLDH